MATTFLEDAAERHGRLLSALAEFRAAGEPTDRVLGAFGLTVTYDFSQQGGIVSVAATLRHTDGAWISCNVPCPGVTIQELPTARDLARSTLIGS